VLVLPRRAASDAPPTAPREIPAVQGLALREAVRALHHAGVRVQLTGVGAPSGPAPAAGVMARPGTLVRVVAP
ncbi:MAG TPA: hypothetical protein VFS44_02905, partial [Gemmatimonadaceae bacterium]|nr:hypothetical protein [Gemmatimonadaceae bacterium]